MLRVLSLVLLTAFAVSCGPQETCVRSHTEQRQVTVPQYGPCLKMGGSGGIGFGYGNFCGGQIGIPLSSPKTEIRTFVVCDEWKTVEE